MQQTPPQPLRAALWMTGAIAAFSAMAVAGRQLSLAMSTFELMTWRSFIGLAIVLAVAGVKGTLGQIRARRMPLQVARNLAHFTGQNLWFWAITMIPLAQVFALEFTAPLWVALIAPFLLGERLTGTRAMAALIGFVGILIVARPDPGNIQPGTIAAAASAICFAFTAIFTKRLTRTEPVTNILFWLTALQAIFGVACSLAFAHHLTLPDAASTPWLLVIGCAGLGAHFCITSAMKLAPASIVMPMDFARLPVIAVVGMLLYHEPLDMLVFLGAALIFGANSLNLRAETRRAVPGRA